MGKRRYLTVLAKISFDDAAQRPQRTRSDASCLMRDVFESFDGNLRRHVVPSERPTLDESLIKFRGRCPFPVSIPQKSGRYGILVRTVADAHNRFLWKAWVYTGRPQDPESAPPTATFSNVGNLVKFMMSDVLGSRRNVTMD